MKKIRHYSTLGLLALLSSCAHSDDTGKQDVAYSAYSDLDDSGPGVGNFPIILSEEKAGGESYFVQEIETKKEDLVFRAKKIPAGLYILKENPSMPDSALAMALSELEGEQVFYFEIEEEMRKDLLKKYHADKYEKAVSYLSFEIQHDFRIYTESGDTIRPSFVLYERNFHLAPFERIIVDFNGLDAGEAFELVYDDQLFGKGEVTFSFPDEKFVENNLKELL
jgi:hypothetical protein